MIQGFTDYDETLVFDGTTFAAGTDFEGTEIEARLGLAVGGHEIHGALAVDSIAEADLAAGRYDDAKVELFLVDWSNAENRLLLRAGNLGEVRCEGAAFAAEVRGLAHRLNEEKGQLYSPTCDADLDDARCGVDLKNPAYRGEGTVAAVEGTSLVRVSGLDAFANEWFSRGRLEWTGGADTGLAVEVKEHRAEAGEVPARALAGGAGADRRRRRVQSHRRMRQALLHLPRKIH